MEQPHLQNGFQGKQQAQVYEEEYQAEMKDVEKGEEPVRPISPLVWRLMLGFGVSIYGSYTILVHLCEVDGKIPFSSASMNLMSEVCKLVLSLMMFVPEVRAKGFSMPPLAMALPFAIPAILYAINNNISVHVQLHMDPATYQVLGNLKILSTAFLYRLIIKRPITPIQWVSLCLLALAGATNSYGGFQVSPGSSSAGVIHVTLQGLLMLVAYCTISGLSGVYTEYILKDRYEQSIHLQNSLLYIFGIILNGGAFFINAARSSEPDSFSIFKGYSTYTWVLILTQSCIGLIMSAIMKHGSNITRLFLISSAMLVTTILSMLIFHLQLNVFFCTAFVLVLLALALYHNVLTLPCGQPQGKQAAAKI